MHDTTTKVKPSSAADKPARGGRRKPEGTRISFYLKNEEEVQALKKLADEEHRESPDNMALAIVRKHLKGQPHEQH